MDGGKKVGNKAVDFQRKAEQVNNTQVGVPEEKPLTSFDSVAQNTPLMQRVTSYNEKDFERSHSSAKREKDVSGLVESIINLSHADSPHINDMKDGKLLVLKERFADLSPTEQKSVLSRFENFIKNRDVDLKERVKIQAFLLELVQLTGDNERASAYIDKLLRLGNPLSDPLDSLFSPRERNLGLADQETRLGEIHDIVISALASAAADERLNEDVREKALHAQGGLGKKGIVDMAVKGITDVEEDDELVSGFLRDMELDETSLADELVGSFQDDSVDDLIELLAGADVLGDMRDLAVKELASRVSDISQSQLSRMKELLESDKLSDSQKQTLLFDISLEASVSHVLKGYVLDKSISDGLRLNALIVLVNRAQHYEKEGQIDFLENTIQQLHLIGINEGIDEKYKSFVMAELLRLGQDSSNGAIQESVAGKLGAIGVHHPAGGLAPKSLGALSLLAYHALSPAVLAVIKQSMNDVAKAAMKAQQGATTSSSTAKKVEREAIKYSAQIEDLTAMLQKRGEHYRSLHALQEEMLKEMEKNQEQSEAFLAKQVQDFHDTQKGG